MYSLVHRSEEPRGDFLVSKGVERRESEKGKFVTVKKGEIVGLDVKGIVQLKTLPHFSFQTYDFLLCYKKIIIKIPYKVFFPHIMSVHSVLIQIIQKPNNTDMSSGVI